MKNKIAYIALIISLVSIVLNIIMIVIMFSNNKYQNDTTLEKDKNNDNHIGIYQTSYYNTNNKQMIYTIRLKEDGKCVYTNLAAEYAGGGQECTYLIKNKEVILTIGEGQSQFVKNAEFFDDGTLYIDGKRLTKIN